MLMILANVPLRISKGIFVHDEIIKMHTIHEGNYTVIKLPRDGNSKAKKNHKKQFSLCKLSSTIALDDFYTDHPFVD